MIRRRAKSSFPTRSIHQPTGQRGFASVGWSLISPTDSDTPDEPCDVWTSGPGGDRGWRQRPLACLLAPSAVAIRNVRKTSIPVVRTKNLPSIRSQFLGEILFPLDLVQTLRPLKLGIETGLF